jgi:uncharacterized membrane protein
VPTQRTPLDYTRGVFCYNADMKFILTKEILGVGVLVSILHYTALKLFLYWSTDWYDILMHFLGGFLIGLIVVSLIQRIENRDQGTENKILLFTAVILSVLSVGLVWELWEIFIGFTDVLKDRADTILDLIMDLIGATASIFYYYFKHSK